MKYVILGGTGTLGQELTRQLLEGDPLCKITIFSRDELKQKQMEPKFRDSNRVTYMIGDIRDEGRLREALVNAYAVFHVAALKHVDSMEENPEESVKTNIIGTMNVAKCAVECHVEHVVFSSTDKAVDPVNVYGMSKGISEKILFSKNAAQTGTRFSVFRWGNVLGSRGSIIPTFVNQINSGKDITITDPQMTRFWIRIEDAVKFMIENYESAATDAAMVPPIKSAYVTDVVKTLAILLKKEEPAFLTVGIRRGEKIHESLRPCFEDPSFNSFLRLMNQNDLTELLSKELGVSA